MNSRGEKTIKLCTKNVSLTGGENFEFLLLSATNAKRTTNMLGDEFPITLEDKYSGIGVLKKNVFDSTFGSFVDFSHQLKFRKFSIPRG